MNGFFKKIIKISVKKLGFTRNHFYKKSGSGFTLYYAVLFASLLLIVSSTMLGIALKEFLLTSSIQESEKAFYAADSGIECAMYWDLHYVRICSIQPCTGPFYFFPHTQADSVANMWDPFTHTADASGAITATGAPMRCNGSTNVTPVVQAFNTNSTQAQSVFSYNVAGSYCTRVEVNKYVQPDDSVLTMIDAYGNNFSCSSASSRKLERGLRIQY